MGNYFTQTTLLVPQVPNNSNNNNNNVETEETTTAVTNFDNNNDTCTTTATTTTIARLDQLVEEILRNDPSLTVMDATDLFSSSHHATRIYNALSESESEHENHSEQTYTTTNTSCVSKLFIPVQQIALQDMQRELELLLHGDPNNQSRFFHYIRTSKALQRIQLRIIVWRHALQRQFVQEILRATLDNPNIHWLVADNAFVSPTELSSYIQQSRTKLTSLGLRSDAFRSFTPQEVEIAVDSICMQETNLQCLSFLDQSTWFTVPVLRKLHFHTTLTTLCIQQPRNDLRQEYLPALVGYISTTTTLQCLVLRLHDWDRELILPMIAALQINPSICRLGFNCCRFNVAATTLFLSYLSTNDTIRELVIRGLGNTFQVVPAAGRRRRRRTIGPALVRALHTSKIECIEFGNDIGDELCKGTKALCWHKTKEITDAQDMAPFLNHMAKTSTLSSAPPATLLQQRLRCLQFQYLGYHGMMALLRFLPTTMVLTNLVVHDVSEDCCCSLRVAKAMVQAFRHNGSCRNVQINYCKKSLLTRPEFHRIAAFIIRNNATAVGSKLLNDPNTDISLLPLLLFVPRQANHQGTFRSTMICLQSMLGREVGL